MLGQTDAKVLEGLPEEEGNIYSPKPLLVGGLLLGKEAVQLGCGKL
jgi:hypothetical protein